MHRHRNRIMTPQATARMVFVEASLSHFSATAATNSLNVSGILSVVMKKNRNVQFIYIHCYLNAPPGSKRLL